MLIVVVNIRVKPEHLEAFKAATIENARNSIQEAGVAQFDVLQMSDDPTRFLLYEAYRSADAPARHRETAHYNTWVATVTDMMAEQRTRTTFANIFPADPAW
jgi:(4S)-4-hydroxy-5-phosphonooxypentane-2,3-dione isomerase